MTETTEFKKLRRENRIYKGTTIILLAILFIGTITIGGNLIDLSGDKLYPDQTNLENTYLGEDDHRFF